MSRTVTLLSVMFAWIFFRAETFDGATRILKGFLVLPFTLEEKLGPLSDILVRAGFNFQGPLISSLDIKSIVIFVGLTIFVWVAPNTQQIFATYRPAFGYTIKEYETNYLQIILRNLFWKPNVIWSIWIGILGALSFLSLSRVSEFLYFQF